MQLMQFLTNRGTQLVMFGIDNSGRNWYNSFLTAGRNWYTWSGHLGTQLIQFLYRGTQLVLPRLAWLVTKNSHIYCDAFCRMHEEVKEQELLLCWLYCNTKLQRPCRCLTPPSALYRRVVETSSVSGASFPVLGVGKQFTKAVFCYVENWTEEAKADQALQWLI